MKKSLTTNLTEENHMADPLLHPGTGAGPDRGSNPSTPRWVKISGIIVIVLVLLFAILHLTGNSPGGPGGHTPPSSVTGHGVQQP